MPGVKPTGMNGHSDYGRYGANGSFDQYGRDDPYTRDDLRGEEEPVYRRVVRNGGVRPAAPHDRFNSDHLADQNSISDFNSSEPAFELDHLATFTAGGIKKGTMHVEEGLHRLRYMENTSGIWTMRCMLLVERRCLVILDKSSGEELERFPMNLIHDPTAVFKNDRREIYNNLVIFLVYDESNRRDPQADMHIFQSVRTPAQVIVDEIFAAKRGQGRVSNVGEAVLSHKLSSQSYNTQGWEGYAYKQQTAQARGTAAASASHSHAADYQGVGVGHHRETEYASQQNSHVRGMTSTTPYTPPPSGMHKHFISQHITTTTRTNQDNFENGRALASHYRDDTMSDQSRQGYKISPPPTGPAPDPYNFGGFQESIDQRQSNQYNVKKYTTSQFSNGGRFIGGAQSTRVARPSYSPYSGHGEELGNNEMLVQDVHLLNRLFDEIEGFVGRLHGAAQAFTQVEQRRKTQKKKGVSSEEMLMRDGMLMRKAQPPHGHSFIDIFAKFKLCFNLLAKLKAHIHDPNAPELTHFLFTPLGLIHEASKDPCHGGVNLADQAVAPVLTREAKDLLLNCLTSKEIELWRELGPNWTTSRDEWQGKMPTYIPRFSDGWQPTLAMVGEPAPQANLESAVAAHHRQILNRQYEEDMREYVHDRVIPFPPEEERFSRERPPDFHRYEADPRAPSPPPDVLSKPSVVGYQHYVEKHIDRAGQDGRNYQANQRKAPPPVSQPPPAVSHPKPVYQDENTAFLEELKNRGAKAYEVVHNRKGNNSKELTVDKGDVLEVLDSSRNWWKVCNSKGQHGYCPYTILKEVVYDAGHSRDQGDSEAGAGPSNERGGSKREELAPWVGSSSSPVVPPEMERVLDSSTSDQLEVKDIPPLTLEEEDRGRYAFQPVEPAKYSGKGIRGLRPTQPQIDLHNELKSRMGHSHAYRGEERRHHQPTPPSSHATSSPPGSTAGVQAFYITSSSTQADVAAWLESKGFSTLCRRTLQGFTGSDVFALHRHEMEQLIGHEEAARLEGQLTLQKKMTGYKTQSAAELNAIFQKRRARSDMQGAGLGQPPDFRPMTPSSYDGPDSDSDSGDRQLAETGKTLRDLLIRQRQKITGSSIFNQQ